MRTVLAAVLIYAAGAVALTGWLYDDAARLIGESLSWLWSASDRGLGRSLRLAPLGLGVMLVLGWRQVRARLAGIGALLVAAVVLQLGFSFFKNAIPAMIPYYADPALAAFDRWLHFGHDPWEIAHRLIGPGLTGAMPFVYFKLWGFFATTFPILVYATDPDAGRARRYIWLYFAAWLVVGNLLATLGASVGPVYYDRLLGSERFAGLDAALASSGFAATALGHLQDMLWARWEGGGLDLGLGISAFPSMHVALATLVALYAAERSRWLAPFGAAFLAAIFVISIYSGYHYALDAYAAIGVVWVGNRLAHRLARPKSETKLRGFAASQLLRSVR